MSPEWHVACSQYDPAYFDLFEQILTLRGIENLDEFLNPSEKHLYPSDTLRNLEQAISILHTAIQQHLKIQIHMDTDLDGICAGVILYRYLHHFTNELCWSINTGKVHGISNSDFQLQKDVRVLVVVDALENDYATYEGAWRKDIEIIVLDHHQLSDGEPAGAVLVSSANHYPNPQLSGAGVTWKVCKALDEIYRKDFSNNLTDLAACGIIGDMCSVGEQSMENRYICAKGFSNFQNPAIKKLASGFAFTSTTVSYHIAPLINAANRMQQNHLAVSFLLSDDNQEILLLKKQLAEWKAEQKRQVELLMMDAVNSINTTMPNSPFVWCCLQEEHANFSGLLANKLAERYQRSALVFRQRDGQLSGSGRAIGIENFLQLASSTNLAKAAGHPKAFGVYGLCKQDLKPYIAQLSQQLENIPSKQILYADMLINPSDLTDSMIDRTVQINRITGTDFPPVRFAIKQVPIKQPEYWKEKHFRAAADGIHFINWNTKFDFATLDDGAYLLDAIGTVDTAYWGKEKVQNFIMDDFRLICDV